jgi:hypothetical protein
LLLGWKGRWERRGKRGGSDVDGAHCILLAEILHLLDVQPLVEQLHGAPLVHELKSPRRKVKLGPTTALLKIATATASASAHKFILTYV